MTSRLALGSAIAAVVVALAVLSMHVVDAHPKGGAGAGHQHGVAVPSPAVQPVASGGTDAHAHHHLHQTGADPVPAPPVPVLVTAFSWDVAALADDHTTSGHANAFVHHFSMCAAVILAALSAFPFLRSRRVSWHAARRLIGTSPGLDPPVPRLALVSAA